MRPQGSDLYIRPVLYQKRMLPLTIWSLVALTAALGEALLAYASYSSVRAVAAGVYFGAGAMMSLLDVSDWLWYQREKRRRASI